MPCRSIIKPVENPRGIGQVYDKDRLITWVTYNLDVIEEEFWADPSETAPAAGTLESTTGSITVIDKGKRLHGTGTLTLLLHDNRRLDFRWHKADCKHEKYTLHSDGTFY